MSQTAELLDTTLPSASPKDSVFSANFEKHLDATIMMVDDEPLMMDVIQGLLEEAGYRKFIAVSDPELAMQRIKDSEPDVILLDLKMPKISGFDILKHIRLTEHLKYLPVIVLTSSTDAESKLNALECGATDFLGKPVDPSELVLRLRNTLSAKAYQDRLAYTDEATGMPNAKIFDRKVEEGLQAAKATNTKMAVLQISVDRLKQVNESLGPHIGDMLIQQVGQRLHNTEKSDLSVTHYGSRGEVTATAKLGGNEFGLLLTGIQHLGDAASFARRYARRVSGTYLVDGKEIFVSAKVGISGYPDDSNDASEIITNAAAALVQSKGSSNEIYSFYSRNANAQAIVRLNQETELRKAIDNQELQLYYQPKIDVESGKITGAEALLRWDNPQLGRVSPADFIPIAEESGLMIPIGDWVLRNTIDQMAYWASNGGPTLPVSINVSALQFVGRHFAEELIDNVESRQIPTEQIVLELTETALIEGGQQATKAMHRLREAGFKLSIDDFGTGYSSLAYLKLYPLDELKIDRSFIQDIDSNESESEIVQAIVSLAKSLNLKVVGEGVETVEQLEVLRRSRCDQFQGFLFSKPITASSYEKLVADDTPLSI